MIENKPLKSDNELNLHFSDEDICKRRGKSVTEQAQENSTKAPEKSSEKPLEEKTNQDLKVCKTSKIVTIKNLR